jgi:hypothetical protein
MTDRPLERARSIAGLIEAQATESERLGRPTARPLLDAQCFYRSTKHRRFHRRSVLNPCRWSQ